MHAFTTKINGREISWQVSITYGVIKVIRATHGVNLMEPDKPVATDSDSSAFLVLRYDLEKFVDIVWELIKDQAAREQVGGEQFALSLDGTGFSACRDAFFSEWVDFFQSAGAPEKGAALRKQGLMMLELAKKIDAIPTEQLAGPIETAIKSLTETNLSSTSPDR